ncbi:hypothetical protein HDU97_003282 [Phlyctochytrium planicorne]|nr:hypothetical protein HDU97_003282 [Phlyctochytrium planicorne]
MPSAKRTPKAIILLALGRDPIEEEIYDHQTLHHQQTSTHPRTHNSSTHARKRSVSPSPKLASLSLDTPTDRPPRPRSRQRYQSPSLAPGERRKEDVSHLYSIPKSLLPVDGRPGLSYCWEWVVRNGWGDRCFVVTDANGFKGVERWAIYWGLDLAQVLNVGGVEKRRDGRIFVDALDLVAGMGIFSADGNLAPSIRNSTVSNPPSNKPPTLVIEDEDSFEESDGDNGRILLLQAEVILDFDLEQLLTSPPPFSAEDQSWIVVGQRSIGAPLKVKDGLLDGVDFGWEEREGVSISEQYKRVLAPPVVMCIGGGDVPKFIEYIEARALELDSLPEVGGNVKSVEEKPAITKSAVSKSSEYLSMLSHFSTATKLHVRIAGSNPGSAWGWSDATPFQENTVDADDIAPSPWTPSRIHLDSGRTILREYLDKWRTHRVLSPPTPPSTPLHSISQGLHLLSQTPIASTPPEPALTVQANARVGLMGNPSDGFFGKTLSLLISNFWAQVTIVPNAVEGDGAVTIAPNTLCDPVGFQSLEVVETVCARDGYYGVGRLFLACMTVFVGYCREKGFRLRNRGFQVLYQTNVPRQVGLAGSSALITALLKGLITFHQLDGDEKFPPHVRANLALSAERDELNIAAGQQDRVIQAYGGLVFMDFERKLMEERGYGKYMPLDIDLVPKGLWMAFVAQPSDSGTIHTDVKARFLKGDPEVI